MSKKMTKTDEKLKIALEQIIQMMILEKSLIMSSLEVARKKTDLVSTAKLPINDAMEFVELVDYLEGKLEKLDEEIEYLASLANMIG